MTIQSRFSHLPIVRVQHSVLPPNYTPPTHKGDETVLRTCSGLLIGGALAYGDRTQSAPVADDDFRLQTAYMSRDAERIQRAFLDPRAAPKTNPTWLERLLDATVRPLVALL